MPEETSIHAIDYAPLAPLRRSGVGIASFCVGIAAAATLMAVFSVIIGKPVSDMMPLKLLCVTFFVPAIGTVLGALSMFQRRRFRGLPIAGFTINVLLTLFWLLITLPPLVQALLR